MGRDLHLLSSLKGSQNLILEAGTCVKIDRIFYDKGLRIAVAGAKDEQNDKTSRQHNEVVQSPFHGLPLSEFYPPEYPYFRKNEIQ